MIRDPAFNPSLYLKLTLIITALIASQSAVLSQQESLSTIRGIVSDSASASPLGNAIIYIANSPLGTSSADDGTFLLKNVPAGEYELVVSRVNYQKASIPLRIEKPDSVELSVKLAMKLIVTPEVEITGEAESKTWSPPQYFPMDNPGVLCVYGTASTVPIAIIHTDSALYLASVDIDIVDGEKYVRLWLLYLNLSETPYDFNPAKDVRLSVSGKDRAFDDIPPERNDWLWTVLDTGNVKGTISKSIQTSLKSMAVQRSEFLYNDNVFLKLLALRAFLYMNKTRTGDMPSSFTPARDASLSGRLYDTYMRSVNVGLIGRNLVYPGNSLHGYLYFPHPGLQWKAKDGMIKESDLYRYEITIATNTGRQKVTFVPD
jgi:hypothetical protein